MRSRRRATAFALLLATFLVIPDTATAQFSALKGTRVRQRISLSTSTRVEAGGQVPVVKYRLDGQAAEYHELANDQEFLSSGPIALTIRQFNPLRTAVTVSLDDAADPTFASMTQLVESLLGLSGVLGAGLPGKDTPKTKARTLADEESCPALDEAEEVQTELVTALYRNPIWTPKRLTAEIETWASSIDEVFADGKSGPSAIGAALALADAFIGKNETAPGSLSLAVNQAEVLIKKIDAALDVPADDECAKSALRVYEQLRLTNPHERLQRLKAIYQSVVGIRNLLSTYARQGQWSTVEPGEFIVRDSIQASADTMKKVTVAFSTVSYGADPQTGTLTGTKKPLSSARLVVRRYQAWVPEIGVGLTYARVQRPKYGTGKNAVGETVIAEAPPDDSQFAPTLMVNFLCGFCPAAALTPMIQIGASTSKDAPALFLGGGIRLLPTSKGDFAVGVGWVLPFARQLKSSSAVGKVIAGTAELDSNLEWQRVSGTHVYVNLQYKF